MSRSADLPVGVAAGRKPITTYGYLANGLPSSIQDPLGNRRTFVWSSLGLLDAEVNELGAIRTYFYDARGNCVGENTGGALTTYTYL